jgi:fructuronate reductase
MPRIVHLGLGNFHRAHQAWYTARANALDPVGPQWAITGVSMRSTGLRDALARQDNRYTLGIRGSDGLRVEELAVHDRLLVAAEDPGAVLATIADPETRIITLTVTEKGYYLNADTGRLYLNAPEIAADLACDLPETAIGLLARGLALRATRDVEPVTVLSCDNISGNGTKLAAAVEDFLHGCGLSADNRTTYPDTMVDRITPANSPALKAEIEAACGHADAVPVMTEAFSEWVIEDRFSGPRPDWHRVGVEIVPDVAPFEMRKLRLLNAAHSYLAYSGQLAGHRYVHLAMADPGLRAGVERLWDEAGRSLPAALAATLPAYCAALIARFSVPQMQHELAQIAMDGSLKMRERLVPIIFETTGEAPQAVVTIAAWIAYLRSAVVQGRAIADPNAEMLTGLIGGATCTPDMSAAVARAIGLGDRADALGPVIAAAVDGYETSS